jgi:hypothetical protein
LVVSVLSELNWTSYVISDFIATGVLVFLAILTFLNYAKEKYPHLFYFGLLWLSSACANFVFNLSHLYLSIPFHIIFFFVVSIEILFTIFFIDFTTRESIDPIKIAIWGILSGMMIFIAINPSNYSIKMYSNGARYITYENTWLQTFFMIISIYWAILILYLGIRLLLEAPKTLKNNSIITFFSIVIIIIRGIFHWQFNELWIGINLIFLFAGFGTLAINFMFHPQLAFILPYKTLRITVLNLKSGVIMFSHDWYSENKSDLANEVLFSGMLQGINAILIEAVNKGNVHEIHLDQAVLLLHHIPDTSNLFVLVATKTSRSLREALTQFSEKFSSTFKNECYDFNRGDHDISIFLPAREFVKACFPFVPDYTHG